MTRLVVKNINVKRAYEAPDTNDGTRILVDRLWPRGLRKTDAAIDRWMKDIAPSTDLRKWFGHDPARWQEFRQRYADEIQGHLEELDELRTCARAGRITLVFAAHDETRNNAVVLRDVLLGRISSSLLLLMESDAFLQANRSIFGSALRTCFAQKRHSHARRTIIHRFDRSHRASINRYPPRSNDAVPARQCGQGAWKTQVHHWGDLHRGRVRRRAAFARCPP